MSDQLLGSEHIGRHDVRLGPHRQPKGLAVGVDDSRHAGLAQLADQSRVDIAVDAARQRPREHADLRAAGEIQELVAEQLDLVLGDARTALVDLGVLAARRVEHRRVRAHSRGCVRSRSTPTPRSDLRRFACRPATREAGCDHGLAERLQRSRDVDALATRQRPSARPSDGAARAGSSARRASCRSPR